MQGYFQSVSGTWVSLTTCGEVHLRTQCGPPGLSLVPEEKVKLTNLKANLNIFCTYKQLGTATFHSKYFVHMHTVKSTSLSIYVVSIIILLPFCEALHTNTSLSCAVPVYNVTISDWTVLFEFVNNTKTSITCLLHQICSFSAKMSMQTVCFLLYGPFNIKKFQKLRIRLEIFTRRSGASERLLGHNRACRFVVDVIISCSVSQYSRSLIHHSPETCSSSSWQQTQKFSLANRNQVTNSDLQLEKHLTLTYLWQKQPLLVRKETCCQSGSALSCSHFQDKRKLSGLVQRSPTTSDISN